MKLNHAILVLSTAVLLSPLPLAAQGASGTPLWTNFYSGPAGSYAIPTAVGVDSQGNVFVAGFSGVSYGPIDFATVKYSEAGVALWTNRYPGLWLPYLGSENVALAVDRSGNVFVTGTTADILGDLEETTVAYSNSGVPLWTNVYRSPGDVYDVPAGVYDAPPAVAVDRSGNVFVTATSSSDYGIKYDLATVAYSGAGVPLWTNRYSEDLFYEVPIGLGVDASGNVYVTSKALQFEYSEYATVAYSGSGVPLWTNRYNEGASAVPAAMAVDASGDVFVTGTLYSYSYDHLTYYATVAYSNSGVPLWTNLYANPAEPYTLVFAVAADSNGHVFVTGTSYYLTNTTLAYSSAGIPLWTNRYPAGLGSGPILAAMAVDPGGNVFVAENSQQGFATVAYSGAGVAFWTNLAQVSQNLLGVQPLAVDSSGNVFVTGSAVGAGASGYATIKYASSLPSAVIQVSPLASFPGSTNLLVVAANNASACVTLNGSASHTPDNGPLSYQWFNDPDLLPFATGAIAADCLGAGTHVIRLVVTDSRGATRSANATVEIISRCAAVDIAVNEIERSNLPPNRKHPLLVSLEAACQLFDGGQLKPGINELDAFEHKVEAQVQDSDPALAQRLTTMTEAIISALRKP